MSALGTVLSAWLIDTTGCRAIFLINLPLAAGAVFLAWRHLPAVRDGRDNPLDVWGGCSPLQAWGPPRLRSTSRRSLRSDRDGAGRSGGGDCATGKFCRRRETDGRAGHGVAVAVRSRIFVDATLLTLLLLQCD